MFIKCTICGGVISPGGCLCHRYIRTRRIKKHKRGDTMYPNQTGMRQEPQQIEPRTEVEQIKQQMRNNDFALEPSTREGVNAVDRSKYRFERYSESKAAYIFVLRAR